MSRKEWSSDKIFNRLINNRTKSTYWDNIFELRSRPNNRIFSEASKLISSTSKKQRIIGVDVLAQLGLGHRLYKDETLKLFFDLLLEEKENEVIISTLGGIGHNNDSLTEEQLQLLIKYKDSKYYKIREGLVFALMGVESRVAIDVLIELSQDKVASIRNLSTFSLGSQIERTNSKIKKALWDRVKDKDEETKLEAIYGLSIRKEREIQTIILKELTKGEFGTLLLKSVRAHKNREFIPLLEKVYYSSIKDKKISAQWLQELKDCIVELKQ